MADRRSQEILDYWFGDLDQTVSYFSERNGLWFGGEPEVDDFIRANFEEDLILAAEGKLNSWKNSPKGALALIILLDQFSLNLYREKPRSYEQSLLAVPIADQIISQGWDWTLTPAEKVFLYLPFEHTESLAVQERSVSLFRRLAEGASDSLRETMDFYYDFAVRHHRVVKRYGRFPDRNEVYGRTSTPEEVLFLASDASPF